MLHHQKQQRQSSCYVWTTHKERVGPYWITIRASAALCMASKLLILHHCRSMQQFSKTNQEYKAKQQCMQYYCCLIHHQPTDHATLRNKQRVCSITSLTDLANIQYNPLHLSPIRALDHLKLQSDSKVLQALVPLVISSHQSTSL